MLWGGQGNSCVVYGLSGAGGSTRIYAQTSNGLRAYCYVTVNPANFRVSSINLNHSDAVMSIGENLQLTASISPSNATNKEVNWSSSNIDIAHVNSNGLVTALAAGSCTITCTAADGSGCSATCLITVTEDGNLADIIGKHTITSEHITVENPTKQYYDNFELTISKTDNGFYITSMFGEDLTFYNDGGFRLTNKGDGNFCVDVSENNILQYDSSAGYLYTLSVYDEEAEGWKDDWRLKLNSDGSISFEDFYICALQFDESLGYWTGYADALYYNLIARKNVGDVNGDGKINGMDVTALVNYVLGKPSSTFEEGAADVNGDGKINGMDVTKLISNILNK